MTEKELILTSILNCERSELYLKSVKLSNQDNAKFNYLIEERLKGEPLQYLLGFTEFMGLEFKVDSRAIIPRPETEVLVEQTINTVQDLNLKIENVLDIGTGSGNIAISIAKFLPDAKILAVDISQNALNLAKENSSLNKTDESIEFLKANILEKDFLTGNHHTFDLIISNPPYIKSGELSNLPKDVQKEPRIALDGGPDGLKFYRAIIKKAQNLLKKESLLAFEIGYNQTKEITSLLQENKFEVYKIIKDYSDFERVIIARQN